MQPVHAITSESLRLAEGVRLTCNWAADLYTLHLPDGAVPLNRTAAAVLALCDIGTTRSDLVARFACDDTAQARYIDAFIAAAQRRNWITPVPAGSLTSATVARQTQSSRSGQAR